MIFQSLLADEQIAAAPVLILGNKIDVPGAGSEDEIRHLFGLHGLTTGKASSHDIEHFHFPIILIVGESNVVGM